MSDDDEFEIEHTPFQKHGIQWLSASSLNTFKNSPARWILSYLAGMKDAPNAAMSRGKAAENAVEWALQNDITSSQEVADYAFEDFAKQGPRRRGSSDAEAKKWETEQTTAQKCAVSAFEYIRAQDWGPLTSSQGKTQYHIAGIEVPIIGYTDFEFGEAGIVVDLKCVGKAQSKPKADHALQIAGYSLGSNYQQALLYAFPRTKTNTDQHSARLFKISPETMDQQLRLAAHTAHAIRRLLETSTDLAEIASLYSVDLESFYFSDAKVREAAQQLFGRDYK